MAPIISQTWHHTEPPEDMQQVDLQLLTICGVSVLGRWCGQMGEHFVGWAMLPGTLLPQTRWDGHPYPLKEEQPLHIN